MSDPSGPSAQSHAPAVEELLARVRQAEELRHVNDEGTTIGQGRIDLFWRLFAGPVEAAVGPWWDSWTAFAAALRESRLTAAAVELRNLSDQLKKLQTYYDGWEAARAKWWKEEADPWWRSGVARIPELVEYGPDSWPSEHAREGPGRRAAPKLVEYGPDSWPWDLRDPHGHPDDCPWQHDLPWRSGGPASLPKVIRGGLVFQHAEHLRSDGPALDWQVVYAALDDPSSAVELVNALHHPALAAAAAIPIGLTLFPARDLVTRWQNLPPDDEALKEARSLLGCCPDEVCRRLRGEIERYAKARYAPITEPPSAPAPPAQTQPDDGETLTADTPDARRPGPGGRKNLSNVDTALAKAKVNVYKLVEAAKKKDENLGPKTLVDHFKKNKDFRELLRTAGLNCDSKMFRAAIAWIERQQEVRHETGSQNVS